jgi:flagellar protein FliL
MATTTAARAAAPADEAAAKGRGGTIKIIVITLVVALAAAGATWFFLLRPPGEEPPPEPGKMLRIEPISVNLADGHFLKVGLGLQLTADAGGHGDPDGAQALDLTISTFSGRDIAELQSAEHREELKHELEEKIAEAYHHEVMHVYFTDFVMQ